MDKFFRLVLLVSAVLVVLPQFVAAERLNYVTIGTGGVTGVYYPTGRAITRILNKKSKEYNLLATVEATGGSVFNVNAIMVGDFEFGIVQSDRQYQAYNGTSDWEGKPQKGLRAVFSIHPETVTLLAAIDSGIDTLADLKGKIVNIGNPGSGQRGNALDVLDAAGIDYREDLDAQSFRPAEAAELLQEKEIDAYFYTVGHPNESFIEATSGSRKTRFIPMDKEIIDTLVKQYSYYAPSKIPVSFYPGVANRENVPGIGVKATFCTSADVDDDVVYAVVREVFENLEEFKKMHPAYSILTRQNMLEGLSAPLHPGATRYYREIGLIK